MLINPRGEIARGRADIRRELESVLTGPALRSTHTSVVVGVEFVTAKVAIVDGEARIEGMEQEEHADTLAHRFTDILVKKDNAWTITHIRTCPGSITPVHDSG